MSTRIANSRMNDAATIRKTTVVLAQNSQPAAHEPARNGFEHRKPLYTTEDAWTMLSLGKTKFYELVGEGRIRVLKEGRKTLVTAEEIDRYVASLQTQ